MNYYGTRTMQKCREKFQDGCEKSFRRNETVLKDFFVCELSECENVLLMRLTNGQTFKMTFEEIA